MSGQATTESDPLVIDREFIDHLLAHIIHIPALFQLANGYLVPEMFDAAMETGYRAIWYCIQQHYLKYNIMPTNETTAAMVVTTLRSMPHMTEEVVVDAHSCVEWLYAYSPASCEPLGPALDWLKQFLIERAVTIKSRKLLTGRQGMNTRALITELDGIVRQEQLISAMGVANDTVLIPDEFEEAPAPLIPCGNALLDVRMSGGARPKEVMVMLAPTGVGKTMLGVDIVASRAEEQQVAEAERPGSGKLAVLITYEENAMMLRPRIWCRCANIDKKRAELCHSYRELSTAGNLLEYEQIKFAKQIAAGVDVPGERERLRAAQVWVNKFLKIGDFSGSREGNAPPKGFGGIPEIAQHLEHLRQTTGREIDVVVIDWAGMAVRRMLQQTGKEDNMPFELLSYVDKVYQQITSRFNCNAWVMHQLAGEYNDKPPTFKFHHSHAEWCKSFAVNAWFAFVMGTKEPLTSSCIMRCTKTRRGEAQREGIAYIDGAFGRLIDGSSFLVVDSATGRISRKDEVERFEGVTAGPRNIILPDNSDIGGI